MTTNSSLKSPGDFYSNEDWRAYVRRVVGAPDVNYALARGRLTLFECFYENRGYPFPETFKNELLSIEPLAEPERTSKLETLNARVLADVTQLLFTAASSESRHGTVISPTTAVEVIDDLSLIFGREIRTLAFGKDIWEPPQNSASHSLGKISPKESLTGQETISISRFVWQILASCFFCIEMVIRHYRRGRSSKSVFSTTYVGKNAVYKHGYSCSCCWRG
jgi:hypothetical protein